MSNFIPRILVPCDAMINLKIYLRQCPCNTWICIKINRGVCDLYSDLQNLLYLE